MRKGIYQIIDELKEKTTLTLSEINDICNEFSEDRHCINVTEAIIQFTSLTGNKSDLTDFKLPNTKETWIEIASALAAEYRFNQPMEVTVEDAARGLEISVDDILSFLKIKHYIMLDKGTWFATALGVKKGCTINTDNGLRLTEKCIEKIRGAFSYFLTSEQQKQVEELVKQEAKND